jgi:hypothetical protein
MCSAFTAAAIAKGGSLYIATKGVKLLKDPKAGAKALGAELAVGTEVKWLGASEKDKHFHEIEVAGKKGWVLQSALSPSKPQSELTPNGRPIDARAFADTKCCALPPTSYAPSPQDQGAFAELQKLEELNRSIGDAELAKKQQELQAAQK